MTRRLAWTDAAWGDYLFWQGQDKKTLRRINGLIADTLRTPFSGLGKPEPLRENLAGLWSRRIHHCLPISLLTGGDPAAGQPVGCGGEGTATVALREKGGSAIGPVGSRQSLTGVR